MTQGALFALGAPAEGEGPAGRPAWVEEILLAGLSWRRSAYAKLEACRKCGELTFYAADLGLDCKTESRVEARVLDRGLEVEALLAGRYTCELEVQRHGGGPTIHRRDRWLAPTEPNTRRRLWVPEHKCRDPLGWELPLEVVYPAEHKRFLRSHHVDHVPPF